MINITMNKHNIRSSTRQLEAGVCVRDTRWRVSVGKLRHLFIIFTATKSHAKLNVPLRNYFKSHSSFVHFTRKQNKSIAFYDK